MHRDRRWTRLPASLSLLLAGAAMAVCGGSPATPIPDVPTRADASHEPPGLTTLNEQPWSGLTANGWRYIRRTSSKDADIGMDGTAPLSPPYVLRIAFTPSMRPDTEPGVHWIALPRPREVYTSWFIKLSPNWTASPAGAAKMTFLHTWPDGQGQVYTGLRGSGAPHWVIVNTEWAPYGQRIWAPNVTTSQISYSRWYEIAWYVRWESTPGAEDGILRWWVDGVLNGDYANVTFPAGGIGFQQFEFAPTLQNPPRAEQYMYIDHTYVSGR